MNNSHCSWWVSSSKAVRKHCVHVSHNRPSLCWPADCGGERTTENGPVFVEILTISFVAGSSPVVRVHYHCMLSWFVRGEVKN